MANFAFALDGKVDMMSLNPLEMTNFELTGTIVGIIGVVLTLIWSRSASRRRRLPDVFVAAQTEEGAID